MCLVYRNNLKDRVLDWVNSMQIGPTQFKMSTNDGSSVFTACFTLFVLDLFRQINSLTQKEKAQWADYINSFQDKMSGYYLPENYAGNLNSKDPQQLTCFCLSALDIIGCTPKYPLDFLKQWPRLDDLYRYFDDIGCFKGYSTTGNLAMFMAIYFTYQYQKNNDSYAKKCLESWFKWHEETQNQKTGFWGNLFRNRYYGGFQNAFHQFVIYNYWNRAIQHHKKIVDVVLKLQDQDGHFGPYLGGGGCYDYDAVDILINCGFKNGYRNGDIKMALNKVLMAIMKEQNSDGGFCESNKRPDALMKLLKGNHLRFIFSGINPYLWYYRLRVMLWLSAEKRAKLHAQWADQGHYWHQSDLWNTWFRCLTIAEIETALNINSSKSDWKFHNFIGLGYFRIEA